MSDEPALTICCDGSHQPKTGHYLFSWVAFDVNGNHFAHGRGIPSYACRINNMTAEIWAVMEAIKAAKILAGPKLVRICSDVNSLVDAMRGRSEIKNVAFAALIDLAKRFMEPNPDLFEFRWVRGKRNQTADTISRITDLTYKHWTNHKKLTVPLYGRLVQDSELDPIRCRLDLLGLYRGLPRRDFHGLLAKDANVIGGLSDSQYGEWPLASGRGQEHRAADQEALSSSVEKPTQVESTST